MYDIEDDRLRTRLFKYLKGMDGLPLQKSVWIVYNQWGRGSIHDQWLSVEIMPLLGSGDQLHIWPLPKPAIKRLRALKSTVDLSFLSDDKSGIYVL